MILCTSAHGFYGVFSSRVKVMLDETWRAREAGVEKGGAMQWDQQTEQLIARTRWNEGAE